MKTLVLPKKAKLILIYAFIIVSFIPLFHVNIFEPYFDSDFKTHLSNGFIIDETRGHGAVKDTYLTIAQPFVNFALKTGMMTLWRAVSPSWKQVRWTEWYAKYPNSTWQLIETPNLSPRYREQRSSWNMWLWDFKQGRFEASVTQFEYVRKGYARYLCEQLKNSGQQPTHLKSESK